MYLQLEFNILFIIKYLWLKIIFNIISILRSYDIQTNEKCYSNIFIFSKIYIFKIYNSITPNDITILIKY